MPAAACRHVPHRAPHAVLCTTGCTPALPTRHPVTHALDVSARPPRCVTMSTPTSDDFSPFQPDTPLIEMDEDEDEDEAGDYEEYPTFLLDSPQSESYHDYPRIRRPHKKAPVAAPPPPPPPPPVVTNITPDVTYGRLVDPSTWASQSAWHGDGWEVASSPSPASATASPQSRFPPTPFPRAAPLVARPIAESEAAAYAVKPLPATPTPVSAPTPATPRRNEKERGLHFLASLLRRGAPTQAEQVVPHPRAIDARYDAGSVLGRESNKLRKRGSVRSLGSARSELSFCMSINNNIPCMYLRHIIGGQTAHRSPTARAPLACPVAYAVPVAYAAYAVPAAHPT
ncbi:hypothetical protein GGX14DRAFT_662268 [Mycena pura]|uniref:Uncharacterized protein n=1 Tax=Mycena pura TaxID=153505 RepID=A0AAD6V2T7_9AGAR|nr:hypothetical protein GGX14DRAFT_662268 [Mycena pura]